MIGRRLAFAIALVATGAAYGLAARLALWMAIPPGYATAVWPAAGLGLVCVLVWRRAAVAGIAIGSCLVNLGTSFDAASASSVVRSFVIAGAIGAGASLQAAVGAQLIRRRIGFPTGLHDERDIISFILLGGPLACLVSASIGVATLVAAGVLTWTGAAFSWWTWWVGDTIGVLVFAPLALLAVPAKHPVWRRRRGIVGIPLVLGFVAITLLFVRVSAWESERVRTDFERRVAPVAAHLKSQLSKYEEVVTSLASFFDASEQVTRSEFQIFCARALATGPAILALSWNPRVPAAQRDELEARARADGHTGFTFTERTPDGLRTAGPRPDYVPIYYVEPDKAQRHVLGYDIASDLHRAVVLEHASRRGALVGTPPIDLVQDLAQPPVSPTPWGGVLLLAPVFDRATGGVRGYTVGVFRQHDIVEAALRDVDHAGMNVVMLDRSAGSPAAPLYATDPASVVARAAPSPPGPISPVVVALAFGDRRWQLEVSPSDAFLASQRSWQAWTVLAAGLLIVGLLGVVLLVTTGRTYRLHEGAERFRALVEASAQIVGTTNAVGEVIEDSPSWRAFTGQSFEQYRGWGRLDAIHPDERAALAEGWAAAVAAKTAIEAEYRLRHVCGDWRWTATRAVPLVDAHGELRGWVTSNTDITERRRAEAERERLLAELRELNAELEQRVAARTRELTAALREREVLLQEVHHRVKNNLQVISSLINMQLRKLRESSSGRRGSRGEPGAEPADGRRLRGPSLSRHAGAQDELRAEPDVHKLDDHAERHALEECQTRVVAIALIHERLYQSPDYARVPFSAYTRSLVSNVFNTMGVSHGAVELDMAIEDVAVPVDKAIPCGLLLNELISNALKHAFKGGRSGKLRVELAGAGDRLRLAVKDNGVGLPPGFDIHGTDSFGLQLVVTLVEQLDGKLAVSDCGGACFELDFALTG